MKRIICFGLSVLFFAMSLLMSVCAIPITDTSEVLRDLSCLKIDDVMFDEAAYPVNKEDSQMYVVAAAEVGFESSENSPGFAFYIYVYNPSCQRIFSSKQSSVKVGFGYNCNEYSLYRVNLLSHSEDWRFLKYRVVDSALGSVSDFYRSQKITEESPDRVYNIVGVYQWVGGEMKEAAAVSPSFADQDIGRCYLYRGSDADGTLSFSTKKLETLDIELNYTYWRSPSSDQGVDLYYQINSIYFALDKQYLERFHHIYGIKGGCNKYMSSDIIVTNSEKINNNTETGVTKWAETIDAFRSGRVIEGYDESLMSLFDPEYYDFIAGFDPECNFAMWNYNLPRNLLPNGAVNCIAYYFYKNFQTPSAGSWAFDVVTSKELEQYIWDFSKKHPQKDGSFAGDGMVNDKLYISSEYLDFDVCYKDLFSIKGYAVNIANGIKGWFQRLGFGKDSPYVTYFGDTDIKPIETFVGDNLKDAAAIREGNAITDFCNKYYITSSDYEDFRGFCQTAEENDQAVVMLRFDTDMYLCQKLGEDDNDILNRSDEDIWRVRMPFYTDLNVFEMTFSEDDEDKALFTVPVSNDPINGIGSVDISGGADNDLLDRLKKLFDSANSWREKLLAILKIIAIVFAAILILWLLVKFVVPLLAPIINAVVTVVTAPFKAISKNRRKKKNDKESKI